MKDKLNSRVKRLLDKEGSDVSFVVLKEPSKVAKTRPKSEDESSASPAGLRELTTRYVSRMHLRTTIKGLESMRLCALREWTGVTRKRRQTQNTKKTPNTTHQDGLLTLVLQRRFQLYR